MSRLTFPRILIVFHGVAVAAALLIYFLTGRNLPIRETILILTFLFLPSLPHPLFSVSPLRS